MKKKILIFLLVFIIALMPVLSFASVPDIQSIIDGYEHYVYFRNVDSGTYHVIVFNENSYNPTDIHRIYYTSGKTRFASNKHVNGRRLYSTNDLGNTWNSIDWQSPQYSYINVANSEVSNGIFIDSTFDIYTEYDRGGTLFFSQPKPPIPILVEIMEGVDSGMILKIILVGLTHLVGFLVLAICLRKGWAFLRRQLAT